MNGKTLRWTISWRTPWPALLAVLALLVLAPQAQAQAPDVRVLIDVSGSMKKNDPQMLRADGLRLLTGLLPADAQAGVWSFGRYVTLDTPVGQVDAAWKRKAEAGAKKIHSRSQNTDIEQALNRVSQDWRADPQADRHIILLTDGMVDVGKDEAANQASRQRILDSVIPRMKSLGARVHTLALSAESDQPLMHKLSTSTDGWNEQVASAADLQRAFLRMFEKAAPRDTVPLVDNRFQVDDSISELTLLVFRAADSPPTEVQQPDGARYSLGRQPDNVRWSRGEGYEMITVSEPRVGEWQVFADVDPDNRVMVVTDLKFTADSLPNHLAPDGRPRLAARLLQEGQVLTDPDFHAIIKVELEHRLPAGQKIKRPLNFSQGVYETTVLDSLGDGEHEFLWRAEGGTFQRSIRQTAVVRLPVEVTVTPLSAEHGDHFLRISGREDMVVPGTLVASASIRDPAGRMISLDVVKEDESAWTAQLLGLSDAGTYNLFVEVHARDPAGKPIDLVLQAVPIKGAGTTVAAPEENAGSADVNWLEVGGWVAGFNLLLGGLAGLVFWLLRRRRGRGEFQLVEQDS